MAYSYFDFKYEELFINTNTEIVISGAFLQRRHYGLCIKGIQRHVLYIYNFFYILTVHLDIINVSHSPTNAQVIVLKTILKFQYSF
jgi:hypothetical protein